MTNPNTKTFFTGSNSTIPGWMSDINRTLSRRPAPSMRGPGAPVAWEETWAALEAELNRLASEAAHLARIMAQTPQPWSPDLGSRVKQISREPAAPANAIHAAATGRGMILLVAPHGIPATAMKTGLLPVAPWGRPDLLGWTSLRGETELLDPAIARPWIWAAWRSRILLSMVEPPVIQTPTEPLEVTIPNFLAMQAAGMRV